MHEDGRKRGIVIIGGGLGGQRCAEALRRNGYDGPLTVVCDEPRRPYDRPPLSKQLLLDPESGATFFRPSAWYAEQQIDLVVGRKATALCPGERRVRLENGRTLRYRSLVIATGSRPRRLPLLEGYANVLSLRNLDDSRRLGEVLGRASRLAVVGAGFIGQEVAAAALERGCAVTIIEAAPSPLAGVFGSGLGEWFSRLHRQAGVEVLTSCTIERVSGDRSVRTVHLSDGRPISVDAVLVGVGVAPATKWLQGSGLCRNGVLEVDPHGRTRDSGVLAVGDVASSFDPRIRRYVPGMHWESAARQGNRAARVILGVAPGEVPLPSFWTDQYGLRIQYLGYSSPADDIAFDGDPESRSFTATFIRAGRPVGALLVDRQRSLPALRHVIEKGTT